MKKLDVLKVVEESKETVHKLSVEFEDVHELNDVYCDLSNLEYELENDLEDNKHMKLYQHSIFNGNGDEDIIEADLLIKVIYLEEDVDEDTMTNVKSEIKQGHNHIYEVNNNEFYVAFAPIIRRYEIGWLLDLEKQGLVEIEVIRCKESENKIFQ